MPDRRAQRIESRRVGHRLIEANFDGGDLSSDGGLMLLRRVDERIGRTRAVAALLKRLKFAARSETLTGEQKSLLGEAINADLEALACAIQLEQSAASRALQKEQPKRQPLPAHLPRRKIHHEPESTVCGCGCQLKRIADDLLEELQRWHLGQTRSLSPLSAGQRAAAIMSLIGSAKMRTTSIRTPTCAACSSGCSPIRPAASPS